MSAGRRTSLVAVLMTCAVLATTASAARAQINGDAPPVSGLAPATPDGFVATASPTLDLARLSLGSSFQIGVSLAAYTWGERVLGWMGIMSSSAPSLAPRSALRSDWRRKRF